jgi:hypothetical protein
MENRHEKNKLIGLNPDSKIYSKTVEETSIKYFPYVTHANHFTI